MSTYDQLAEQIKDTLAQEGNPGDSRIWGHIYSRTKAFMAQENLISSDAVNGLEGLESVTPISRKATEDISVDSIREFVDECKVPTNSRHEAMLSVAKVLTDRQLSNPQQHFSSDRSNTSTDIMPTVEAVGPGAIDMINRDAALSNPAMEAFGADMDKIQSDAALNISVSIMRFHNSLIDRILPRKSHNSNTVTISVPDPTLYDLTKSHDLDNRTRNKSNHEIPMLDLYTNPNPATTNPKRVVPLPANDTSSRPKLMDGNLRTGLSANLFDLTLSPGRLGSSGINFTDILSEGGRVEYLLVEAKKTEPNGTVVSELFKVRTAFNARSRYIKSSNNTDSGDTTSVMNVISYLKKGQNTANGVESTLLSTFDDAKIALDVNFTSQLNLKTGTINGSGTLTADAQPLNDTLNSVPQAQLDALDAITFSIVAYMPEVYFSEENLRQTSRAVRLNRRQYQFEIPVAATYVVDFSLSEQQPEDVLNIIQNIINLGNSDRSLRVLESKMDDVYNRIQHENEFGQELHFRDRIENSYAAGTLSHPTIIRHELDYDDPDSEFLAMRQSEHLSDVHALARETLLNIAARLKQRSLYALNLEPDERVVWKVVTSTLLQNTIMGIRDYWNTLDDTSPRDGTSAEGLPKGSTYSFYLPNHDRIDVIATEFDQYADRMVMIPIRENDPTHVTSFATQYDRGTFVANYTPTNNNAAFRRALVNTREIPHVTNPVGAIIDVKNLEKRLPNVNMIGNIPSYQGEFASLNDAKNAAD